MRPGPGLSAVIFRGPDPAKTIWPESSSHLKHLTTSVLRKTRRGGIREWNVYQGGKKGGARGGGKEGSVH